ncbi:hypothetical protein Q3C01_28585 [Bradyrhizobium sp. UFLA05-109]
MATNDEAATIIDSAPIEQLVANSTIDIAGALNDARSRWRSYRSALCCFSVLFALVLIVAIKNASPAVAFLVAACAALILGGIFSHGRSVSTLSLDYDLTNQDLKRFGDLTKAFAALSTSSGLWRIPLEREQPDWKRNAGAAKTVERKAISLSKTTPALVRSNVEFLRLPLGKEDVYFAPDAILVEAGHAIAALRYSDLQPASRATRFIENDSAPTDATVVGETWRYVNRNGGPDRRFNSNPKLPICLYGEIDLCSASGLNERIHCSRLNVAEQFVSALAQMRSRPTLLPSTQDESHISGDNEHVSTAYAGETDAARSLAINHGRFWEFLLVEELMKTRLRRLKADYDKFFSRERIDSSRNFSGCEFLNWIVAELERLSAALATITACVDKQLIEAMGAPGVPGDPMKILAAVDSLFQAVRRFLTFEVSVSEAEVPPAYLKIREAFRGITQAMIATMEDLLGQWTCNTESLKQGSREFNLKVNVAMPQLTAASIEIDSVKKAVHSSRSERP